MKVGSVVDFRSIQIASYKLLKCFSKYDETMLVKAI